MKDIKTESFFGVRHIQITLLFGLLMVGYGMRVNLSVGIVAMTNDDINPNFPSYNWSVSTKSVVQSSFFWGYIIPQVGAGQLAEHYGPKWFLIAAMTLSSMFTLLIPIIASYGAEFVVTCRVMQGFTQGFFFPSIQYLLSKWVPFSERSRMGSFVYAGGSLGSVLSMPVTGWISASPWGWPSAFYLYALMGVIWVGLWYWLGSNDPAQHQTISETERKYILQSSGASNAQEEYATPWKEIVTSLPVWAIVVAYMGQHWGYWTLMTEIPTYMNAILDYDIEANGLLSAAPYLTLWILSFFFSYTSDLLINKKILSTTNTRKLASAIGLVGPAIALFVLGALGKPSRAEAIGLLILAVGINSAIFSGHQVNHIDISPRFAATLMGITNGIGNICSLVAPLTVQYVVSDERNPDEWRIVFFIAAGIYLGSDVIYTIFGKGERQGWDTSQSDIKRQISRESVIIT